MSTQRRFGSVSTETSDAYEEKQEKQAKAGTGVVQLPDGLQFYRFPKETKFVRIDVIPFVAATANGDQPLPRYNYHVHRIPGEGFTQLICPQQQLGQPCPICEYTRTLDWNNPQDQEIRKSLRPQKRQLYAIIPLDGDDQTKGKLWVLDTSEYGFGRILDEKIKNRDMRDPQENKWNLYADLLEGWSLKLNLGEQSFGGAQSYTCVTSIDIKPRAQQYDESWYDKVPDLTQCVQVLPYDEIKQRWRPQAQAASAPTVSSVAATSFDPTAGYSPMVQTAPATQATVQQAPSIANATAAAQFANTGVSSVYDATKDADAVF